MKAVICPHCKCQCWDADHLWHHIGHHHRDVESKENTSQLECESVEVKPSLFMRLRALIGL